MRNCKVIFFKHNTFIEINNAVKINASAMQIVQLTLGITRNLFLSTHMIIISDICKKNSH